MKVCSSFFVPQAEQIVAKLMMNMAAVDRRLAEETSRQNLVSYMLFDLRVSEWPGKQGPVEMTVINVTLSK